MDKSLRIAGTLVLAQAFSLFCYADCPPPRCDTSRTIITVGFAPGGATDILARRLAQGLNIQWGASSATVENMPGQQGLIAAAAVSRAAPDGGYALLATSNLNTASALNPKFGFSPEKDLIPAGLVASVPFSIAVASAINVNSMSELVSKAKESPGRFSYGSSGWGSMEHILSETLNRSAGIQVSHVPYKGAQPVLTDLIGGQIQYMISSPILAEEGARQGRIRVIATTGRNRSPKSPNIPTVAEQGMQDLTIENRIVLYVPRGTSADALSKWNAAVAKAVQSPEMKQFIEQQGGTIDAPAPERLGQLISAETGRWAAAIRSANIRIE